MLPTVTPPPHYGKDTAVRRAAPPVTHTVTALDVLLFDPRRWFVLNEHNEAIPGVRPATLAAALELIGQGTVTSVFGHVRDGVRVVDVDAHGVTGDQIVAALTRWATRHGIWHLVRPSGGAPGRAHVFLVPGEHDQALHDLTTQLAAKHCVPANHVDLRRLGAIRPLSAPHRNGTHTRPAGDLGKKATHLRQALATTPLPLSRPKAPRPAGPTGSVMALEPRPRRRRDLPAPIETYLTKGTPFLVAGQDPDCDTTSNPADTCTDCDVDHSRSTLEAITTSHLLRAGHTARTAWAVIATAHPNAMSRTRTERSHSWWVKHVWNKAVLNDNQLPATTQRSAPQVRADVAAARDALRAYLWAFPVRRRASMALVGHHVLDRIERTGERRVPVPERDLVLDTGIRCRKTIRACLRALNGHLGTLHTEAWNPREGGRDSSSFEFEIAHINEGVSQIPPPSSHTPHVCAGTWATLPRAAHAIWRSLVSHPSGLPAVGVAYHAALTTSPTDDLTPAQLRSTTAALIALSHAGLAEVDHEGNWKTGTTQTAEAAHTAAQAQQHLHDQVTAERRAYRANNTSAWCLARARAYRAQQDRERAWWTSLSSRTRHKRRHAHRKAYAQATIEEQQQFKARQATRRGIAGINEAQRHGTWINSHSPNDYARLSRYREQWFAALSKPRQVAYAQAWEHHRERYGVPRGTTHEQNWHTAHEAQDHLWTLPQEASRTRLSEA